MPFADFATIVLMALGCALLVGGLGLLALRMLRHRSLLVQVCVVVLASVLSLAAGVIAVGVAMYISPHDLLVVITVTVVAAVVSIGVALLLGIRMGRAGAELRRRTQAVGEGELLDEHPPASSSAEFDRLAVELAETSRRLSETREQVQAIDASRRELVAWISHDLRSPLSGLRAMTEALEDGMAADSARFHRQMRAQVDRLTALVDNLFELSKISSGTLVLSPEPLSLHDLVSDAAAELSPVANAKSIVLVESTSPDHTLVGDPRELSRVVSNLLVNALQHTPAGGEVRISTMRDDEGVTLAVHDSGEGIAEADMHRIFDAGWRGTHARTPSETVLGAGGAGLGLAIARGIVEAHRGRISARNCEVGCRFEVRLPHDVLS